MKKPDFLHDDADSWKLVEKYWGGRGRKCVWSVWSRTKKLAVSQEAITE